MNEIRHALYCGRGFGMIRAPQLLEYPTADSTMIWLGLQAYISNCKGRQDANGNMIGKMELCIDGLSGDLTDSISAHHCGRVV